MMQDPEGADRVATRKSRIDEALARHIEEHDERGRKTATCGHHVASSDKASMLVYVAHSLPASGIREVAFVSFQSGQSIADTGVTKSVAGTNWLHEVDRRLPVLVSSL